MLPSHWSHGNPVDVLGDAGPERFAKALDSVISDRGVDAALVILTPQAMTDPTATAELMAQAAEKTRKLVLTAWMGGQLVAPGREIMAHAGIASYESPDRAVRAFTYLDTYRRNRQLLYETPSLVPLDKWLDPRMAHEQIDLLLADGRETLSEIESKSLLSAYGIPNTVPLPARTSLEAIRVASRIGYPVVMKIHSPQIIHKTEVRGVVTDVTSDDQVRRVFQEMVARRSTDATRRRHPGRHDPTDDFFGRGDRVDHRCEDGSGVWRGHDGRGRGDHGRSVPRSGAGMPPLDERLARRMIESLRIRPLLEGFRGRSPVDLKRLVEVLIRSSYLIADIPEIAELDINPLLVTPEGVTALDARVILNRKAARETPAVLALGHLPLSGSIRSPRNPSRRRQRLAAADPAGGRTAVAPVDGQLFGTVALAPLSLYIQRDNPRTGHPILLRRLRPHDGHRRGDRRRGGRQLVGMGLLVADADHRHAEYAVLVAEAGKVEDWVSC